MFWVDSGDINHIEELRWWEYTDLGQISVLFPRRRINEAYTPNLAIKTGSILILINIDGSYIGENIAQFKTAPIDTADTAVTIIGVVRLASSSLIGRRGLLIEGAHSNIRIIRVE